MNSLRQKSFFGNLDWLTICLWFILCIIGLFNIHAAVYDPQRLSSGFVF